jgi:hypothetical protein
VPWLPCRLRPAGLAPLALILALLAGAPATATAGDAPSSVQDLAYGEVLFHFYGRDYFQALTRLLAAEERREFAAHGEEARLLHGGLALSYGQHQQAGAIFRDVLDAGAERDVRNRAWWYLAKLYYQRGYAQQARDALRRIEPPTAEATEAQRRLLGSLIELDASAPAQALALLDGWRGGRELRVYADYNRGVAAIRAGDAETGERILERLGQSRPEDAVGWVLRDRANLALGMRRLQAAEDLDALEYFRRIRLQGPLSTRGLLGAGWAASRAGEYEQALGPWRELQGRSAVDPAVQEALLAVPFIYGQLGAFGQAAQQYERAIAVYDSEQARLDAAIATVREGALIRALLSPQGADSQAGWFRQLRTLPQTPATRYLPELLASHDFQEGYKNLRDIEYLRANLTAWDTAIEAFEQMLQTRREAYEARAPAAQAALAQVDLPALEARRDALRTRLLRIERAGDALALASDGQRDAWDRLQTVERRLPLLEGEERERAQEKFRLLRGSLIWELHAEFVPRVWTARKGVRQLDQALEESRTRVLALERALRESLTRFEGYDARIEGLRTQIPGLLERSREMGLAHRRHLEALAVARLQAQKERIDVYLIQARFSLAQMYDRAAQDQRAAR